MTDDPILLGTKFDIDDLVTKAEAKRLTKLDEFAHLIIDNTGKGHVVDFHATAGSAPRASQDSGRTFNSPEGFATYCKQLENPDKPLKRLYAKIDTGSVSAVFDDDQGVNDRGWLALYANFMPIIHTAFAPWLGTNGKSLGQAEFADFLMDNSTAIAEPTAATVATVVTNLEMNRSSNFASKVDMSNGNFQFTVTEDDKPKANVAIPKQMKLVLPIFHGSEALEMLVELRYRFNSGKLTWSYHIHQLDRILDVERKALWATIEEKLGIPVLW